MAKPEKYDICIISFSSILTDSRTLNLASALTAMGKSVAVVSLGERKPKGAFTHYTVSAGNSKRHFLRWHSFGKNAVKLTNEINPAYVVAAELYSLAAATKFKKKHNSKLIYDSREIYSQLGPIAGQKFKQSIITYIEKRQVSAVDEFIVSGEMDAEYLKSHLSTGKPFHLVMNLPYYHDPIHSDNIRERFNLSDDKLIILYQGAVLTGRGIIRAIKALEYLPDAVLCIIGDGEHMPYIREYLKSAHSADRVYFTGKINYSELHEWTCSADIGLCLFEPVSDSYMLALPNKLFEYCMAGIPSVATELPAIRSVIKENKIALLINEKLEPIEIARAVNLISRTELGDEIRRNCLEVSHRYSYESQYGTIGRIFA